ncbi:hypothetical protein LTR56_008533 [Elasticomyces elasticus]|nr:hypothetical protein LTR56_008533 [Elasticomyces elasticus]KAK3653336.1 hypothetical protein LTR22_011296 [Elasticomyces elasticus]KAK4914741.1 hypothetical protein LTR49_017083 [Elasticomyces elasticus]KAK5758396.1 hypothetical protein LTS12_011569 [Elasticomyces elasticus]
MATNTAAWIKEKCGPFVIEEAPMPILKANEIVLRSRAVAINPVDAAMYKMGVILQQFPAIIGCDVAGTITAVGSSITRFKPGDRILACVDSIAGAGAFQLYCVATEALSAKLPDNVSFTDGCVLPLGLCTAAASMFQKANLGLSLPQIDVKPLGKVLVIWGGSSSVGSSAIQMAKAAGFEVATTCSARNIDYCKTLGADYIFDHTKESVVNDILEALQGKESAGVFDAIMAADTLIKCANIAHQLDGKKHLATVLVGPPTPQVVPEGLPEDVTVSYCWGTTIANDEVGAALWGGWITSALANGALKGRPYAEVVGQGLEALQEACERMAKGVSAKKLVVEIP